MGSRASYIAIERAAIAVYTSHWGAMSVPAVVVGGPAETLAYIRGLQQVKWLYDTVWAEGGILLDADTHTLIFWGGENVRYSPYLRRLFLPVLRRIWQGWSVSWATHGIVDFAEYPGVVKALGIDPASVIGAHAAIDWNPYPESEVRTPHEQPWTSTAITVKWEDGWVADYTFDQFPHGYLTFGSALLDILREREPEALPREDGDGDDEKIPEGGAYADLAERVLWIWEDSTINTAYLERIAQAWPGWRMEGHLDGLAHQVTLSGRDPALVAPPLAQVSAELLKELTGGDSGFDPVQFAQMTLAHADPATTTFAPGFFEMDRPAISAAERRELLIRLIQQVGQEQAQKDADQ